MKTNLPENPDDARLRERLRDWKVGASLPPGFREGVWRRIERSETRLADSIRAWFWERVAGLIERPAFALAYVTAMLVLGMSIGLNGAVWKTGQWEKAAATRYLEVVDPLRPGSPM